MERSDLSNQAKNYFLPVLLGNTPEAKQLASRLYSLLKIKPFVFDEKRSWKNAWSSAYYFVPLTPTDSRRLLCEQLVDYVRRYPHNLPILVPLTDSYREAVEENRELFEKIFIIRDAASLLNGPPLSKFITRKN